MKHLTRCLDITYSQFTIIVPYIKAKGGVQQPQPAEPGCASSLPSASPWPQLPTCTPPSTREPGRPLQPTLRDRAECQLRALSVCSLQDSCVWDASFFYCC